MGEQANGEARNSAAGTGNSGPRMLVGVTHHHTCIVHSARLRALRQAGFSVTLVCGPGEELDRTAKLAGVDCVPVPMQREISLGADLRAFWSIWRLIGRLRPQIVEFATPKAGLLGMTASALRRVPHRVYLLRGLKLETARGFKRRLLAAAEWLTCACAQVVLVNSPSLREAAIAAGIAPAARLQVLDSGSSIGVDVERFSPGDSDVRIRRGISQTAKVIGYVGRLTRDKGLPELVRAFDRILQSVPDAVLLLVGWFDASEDALDLSEVSRIGNNPRIHWVGFQQDTVPWYRAMDVMVLPTLREGFPNVVLEALATGVPVVTTTATGSRDSVLPGITGELVPPGDSDALAVAVTALLADAELRRKMGAAARAWVHEHYRAELVQARVVEFYKELSSRGDSCRNPVT